jgi:hypothetical protein
MEAIKKFRKGNQELRIVNDEIADSPRDWDNLGTIAYRHRRYTLGEIEIPRSLETIEEVEKWLIETHEAVFFIPIYAYEHSGISLSLNRTGQYADRFDSGMIGYFFVTQKQLDSEGLNAETDKEKIIEILKCEIKTYNAYLNGEVYGFQLIEHKKVMIKCPNCEKEHETGESEENLIDSCYGFYDDEKNDYGLSQMIEHTDITEADFKENWKEVE